MFPFLEIGSLKIPTFFFVISLATSLSLFVFYHNLHHPRFENVKSLKIQRKTLFDLALVLMICGFIGGRLLHVVFELPHYYKENPIEVFKFWNGGFVFYGGFLLAFAAALLFVFILSKKTHHSFKIIFRTLSDFYAAPLALAYAVGRLGCFLEGCCFGKFTEMPWAIQLRHPTTLYASFIELTSFFLLRYFFNHDKKSQPGDIFALWLILHALNRLIMEFFRDDFRGTIYFGFSISTIISLGVLILGFWLQSPSKKPEPNSKTV